MLTVLIALGLVSVYAIAVTAIAALLFGQQRMMNRMTVESKRSLRREIRRSSQHLETLMQRLGVQTRRRSRDPDASSKPSRNIVTPSMIIERQREEDAQVPRHMLEQVPPAIRTQFLRDTQPNGNHNARPNQ